MSTRPAHVGKPYTFGQCTLQECGTKVALTREALVGGDFAAILSAPLDRRRWRPARMAGKT